MRKYLKQKRIKKGYTQSQIAEMLNISRPHYCKIETGIRTPSLRLAIEIKKIIGYEGDDLFDDFENK